LIQLVSPWPSSRAPLLGARTLEQLVASTNDTALLVVPDGGELLYVDKVISDTRDVRTDRE